MRVIQAGATIITSAIVGFMPLCTKASVVAYWDFAPNGRGVTDASGNGNYLVNTGVTFTNGAAIFSGTQTVFNTVKALNLTNNTQLTIELFVKTSNTNVMMLFEHTTSYNNTAGAFGGNTEVGGGVSAVFKTPTGYCTEKTVSGALTNGQWHHLAFVFNSTSNGAEVANLFLDRVKQTDGQTGGNGKAFLSDTFYIGSRANSSLRFVGEIDDVRISNQALATNEFLQARSVPVPANLIAYWPFTPGDTLSDSSGNSHDLSNSGVTFANGAAVFSGTQTVFSTADKLNLIPYSNLTFEAFVRSTNAGINYVFVHGPDWNSVVGGIISYIGLPGDPSKNGQVSAGYRPNTTSGSYNYDQSAAGAMTDGMWHHLALTLNLTANNGKIAELYLDGLKQTDKGAPNIVTPLLNETFYIGSLTNSYGKLIGELDDVRISDRVLAPAEFLQARSVSPPALIAYWPFNPGNELADSSGNGNGLTNNGVTFNRGAAVFNGMQTAFNTLGVLSLSAYPAITVEAFIRSASTNMCAVFELTESFWVSPSVAAFLAIIGDPSVVTPAAGTLSAAWRANDGYQMEKTGLGAMSDNRWHHMALVLDSQTNKTETLRLYLDGIRQTDVPQYMGEVFGRFPNAKFYVGSRNNSELKLIGEVDDVRITGRALEPADFLAERSGTRGTLISLN